MLTYRQKSILDAIINEFINTAQAVGSLSLAEKYKLGVSPATLRSEMCKLVDEGYLFKEHSSAGRIPTTTGLRFFLEELLEEENIDVLEEVELKEKMFSSRFNRNKFIKEAVKTLSKLTELVSFSILDNSLNFYGISNLLKYNEFHDINVLESVLTILETENILINLVQKSPRKNDSIYILIGEETGIKSLNECSIIFSQFNYYRGDKGFIGIIGPKRMHYNKSIPAVKLISNFINDSLIGWE